MEEVNMNINIECGQRLKSAGFSQDIPKKL